MRLRLQILSFLYFPSFIFKETYAFHEEDNPSQKVITVDEKLDDIGIENVGNLHWKL